MVALEELGSFYTFMPRPDQPERYDEQAAFYHSNSKGVVGLIGGNGSGTTEVALAKVAKFLLSDQPPPRKDTPFWIISDSYDMCTKTCWKEKLYDHGHIPGSEVDWDRIRWYDSPNQLPYFVPLKSWPEYPGKNWVIEFKSYGQGRHRMQAQSIGGFLFVEQFPWGLMEEVLRGCREYNFPGSKLFEYTPVDPNLSLEVEEMMDDPETMPAGWEFYRCNTECAMEAGHVDPQWFTEFFGMVKPDMRETRLTGAFASFEGQIYKNFNPHIHLVGDDVIFPSGDFPKGVYHRRSNDWGVGPENHFAAHWGYRNGLGQWFIYDEYYCRNLNGESCIEQLCEVVKRWPWPEHNTYYGSHFADPSGRDEITIASRFDQYCPRGDDGHPLYPRLSITGAANALLPGIEHVQWLLKPSLRVVDVETGKIKYVPRLFIHKKNCPYLARQMRTYRWLKSNPMGLNPKAARREPLKKDDHAVDSLRYMVFTEAVHTGTIPSSIKRKDTSVSRGVRHDRVRRGAGRSQPFQFDKRGDSGP